MKEKHTDIIKAKVRKLRERQTDRKEKKER